MKKITTLILLCCALGAAAQEQTVRYFSHRGGRQEFDENTLSAFEASYQAGYRGFETDVRITKDGVLVILHDPDLARTTDTSGIVEEMTAEQIRRVNTKGGHKVLFLDELMDWIDSKGDITYVEFEFKTYPKQINPEIKYGDYCDKLYERVMRNKPSGATYLFTSGHYAALRYLQQSHPDAQMLVITGKPCNDETIDLCSSLGIYRLGATIGGTSRSAVKKAHEKGIIVSLWPGNSVEDAVLGAYLGADYLCTDVPVAVKTALTKDFPHIKAIY